MPQISQVLEKLNIKAQNCGSYAGETAFPSGDYIKSYTPINGDLLAEVDMTTSEDYHTIIEKANEAFKVWRTIPAPKRGEIVRQYGDILRQNKMPLGQLVSIEMGKSLQEGLGEVQEMIDICDFAVGLSRQLYGLSMHSERPNHRMFEQWHPLGIVGIISAFNFPVAVWSWNSMIAIVCGNVSVWKPSEKAPICGVVCHQLLVDVLKENNLPTAISCLINGGREVGELMTNDHNVVLVSATGSTRMGKEVAKVVGGRLGKYLLELGGNNAMIITESADLDLALVSSVFGAVGTAGQRCTSTRRLIIHESIYDQFIEKLINGYKQIKIGNPLDSSNHMGPVIDEDAVQMYEKAIQKAIDSEGKVLVEGGRLSVPNYENGHYVKPCVIEINPSADIVATETFSPILYVHKYTDLSNAIAIQNQVNQGLSSCIITERMKDQEQFLSAQGSDCGIANVNIGTSGAEIGGAFGGEKETGGGRESGSDSWKAYMRRQTCTVNYGKELPLAQGIEFNLG